MNRKSQPGLGELLRHVSELVELGAQEHDQQMGVNDRARCPPVLRVIGAGAQTITEITARTHLTQGAIRQTVGHMETDGVIPRQRAGDGRKSTLQLTAAEKKLVGRLDSHWATTFEAIEHPEHEVGYPLRQVQARTARALEQQGFSERLHRIKKGFATGAAQHE